MWICKRLICLCLLAAATAPACWGADAEFEAFFKLFKEKRENIGSLRAEFVQKTFLPEEVITASGVLQYSRPRRILFTTSDPERAVLVDGRRGYEYDAEIQQLTIFDIEDNPRADIFFLGFDDNADALQRAYQVELMIADDARGRQGLKIKPRPDAEEEAYFLEVNLFLRDADLLPYRIHIVNDAESQLFIDVNQMETQESQMLEDIRIFLPEGVKIIENDAVVDAVGPGGRYIPSEDAVPILTERDMPPPEAATTPPAEQP